MANTILQTAEAQVKGVLDAWASAMREKDADGVISHQAKDFVQFALAPPLVAKELDRNALDEWFSSWRGPIEYEIRDQRITAADELAFCRSLNRMRATASSGEQTELWFRQTMCLRRLDGGWKIVHEHDSVPFYMDEDARAAIDLKP